MKKFLCAFFFIATFGSANAVTFNYIGNPYTYGLKIGIIGQLPLQDVNVWGANLTASISFDNTVTANFSGTVSTSNIWTLSLTSGIYSINAANFYPDPDATFALSDGRIVGWTVKAWSGIPGASLEIRTASGDRAYAAPTDFILNWGSSNPNCGNNSEVSCGPSQLGNGNKGSPGVWTKVSSLSAVPLPAALPLFGAAIVVLIGMGIRRKHAIKPTTL